ncbi:unnamed protein product [Durusdinium trenchii]|uniref:Uncharacterized protein n=1 Tax=Durusdinium trenchii TaxID=1381693 RepID=A0ABP0LGM6_9DINO
MALIAAAYFGNVHDLMDGLQNANLEASGAADICEAHGTARALQVLQGVDLKNEDPVCESEGELAPIGTEERRIGTFTKEEGDKSESSQRPCFGSAVDPTFLEEEAEQTALAMALEMEQESA